ncbi:cyclin-D5-3-like [Typha latifolia]|uniref:cyclin-D5-3-like n=1 Tax=Typha latifolia TaxID=4733 RepID=UPI003C2F6A09
MGDAHCSVPFSRLICQEDGRHLDQDDDEEEKEREGGCLAMMLLPNGSFLPESDEDFIKLLLSKESTFEIKHHDRSARSDAVRWILRSNASFGFGFKTAYVAVAYFDRFFAHRVIDRGKSWAIHLLSIACLSIATKMEECHVPVLSEFWHEEYEFRCKDIRRMELLVLSTLEWRMSMVTPFSYLSYFASKFVYTDLVSKAAGFIFATIKVMNLVEHRPSTVAAAAILAAIDERLTQDTVESKLFVISLSGPLDTEHVFSCYTVMVQEAQKEKLKSSKELASSSRPAANNASIGNSIDAASVTSFTAITAIGSKRRRLQSPNA